ncbi:MAG: metal-dependent transcriptional regulator [Thermoplasmata archaeon]|nr:metal-dependent transcriptional regulator [Thermoplasmata archaeon]MCI4338336.1 metal-dependent transcriptional regulator [Thermoplasmata archaeon]
MEALERLTRRQLDVLRAVQATATSERGAPLNSIAMSLSISAPSALQHLTAVEELGLVSRYRGKSRLSARGELTLAEYRRHHRIAESLFGNLGLSPREVCRAAQEVDLALSHLTIERLCDAEGHPSVCPHGEPIPPCSGRRGAG